jgi:hypothetical protein
MTPTEHFVAEFVESFPSPLVPGVLYISTTYSTAGHLCACGCGREIVTKLSPARYKVVFDGDISLSPSVAATALPCNSHYFITRGEVDWHRRLNAWQTERVRTADQLAVTAQRERARPGCLARVRRRLRAVVKFVQAST